MRSLPMAVSGMTLMVMVLAITPTRQQHPMPALTNLALRLQIVTAAQTATVMDGPMMGIGHQTTQNSGQIATVTAMVTSITMKSSTHSIMSTNVVMHFPIIQHNGMIRIAMAGETIMRMSLGMNLENLPGQVS